MNVSCNGQIVILKYIHPVNYVSLVYGDITVYLYNPLQIHSLHLKEDVNIL